MKRINQFICAFCLVCGFTACNDLLETNPDNIINDDEYINKEDEIYKGMLGILNRMQEAGDQAIWLTDTRASVLETTDNAPDALKAIYNYDPTNGNEYADPTCYYAIVIACNDFFHKMGEYHKNVGGMSESTENNFKALLSSAIRFKVWAYWMLGRIYGKAYWFDDPLTDMKDLSDTSVFTYCDMQQLTDKCLSLLDNGMTVDGLAIPSDLKVNWASWLNPETEDATAYVQWEYLVPPYILLRAELVSWRCNYESEEAAQADWLWIRDNLMKYLYDIHMAEEGTELPIPNYNTTDEQGELAMIYQTNLWLRFDLAHSYTTLFSSEEIGNKSQVVSAILYDYTNHQRNRLVQYLCPAYPSNDAFYLQPSQYGQDLYNEEDIRGITQRMVMDRINGKACMTKYYMYYDGTARTYKYLRTNIFEIQPSIITFRGHDFHFLLAEAENHLGNWDQAETILNRGITSRFPSNTLSDSTWCQYYASWFAPRGGYGNAGIVGAAAGTVHKLPKPTDPNYSLTEAQRKEIYDWAIADEHLKEYVAEGKSYSYLCKMAERYSNAGRGDQSAARDSLIKRIIPKYTTVAAQQKVRSSISGNGYFIQWDLKD